MKTPLYWAHQEFSQHLKFRSGLNYQSTFVNHGAETLQVMDKSRQLIRIEENVFVPGLAKEYRNIFWLDPVHGAVVKSEQYINLADTLVQMTVLKPYAG